MKRKTYSLDNIDINNPLEVITYVGMSMQDCGYKNEELIKMEKKFIAVQDKKFC